ncbi:hypothetical protein GF380_03180, partial [Candidatus Uhrbacteria bacterium]|nr:hypothetical protein [Candidatus Uhrbacteria bacterium]MBD3284145.1 hypothetical protein [Candidatus Uhrbacteria bacterium]
MNNTAAEQLPVSLESDIRELAPRSPEADRTPEERYRETVRQTARMIIYEDADLESIRQRIDRATEDVEFKRLEQDPRQGRQLESLIHLSEGIEANEISNDLHSGPLQTALLEHQHPEQLNRRQVLKLMQQKQSPDPETGRKASLLELIDRYEQATVESYRNLLITHPGDEIKLSERISIHRTDIEALINDVKVRMAERIEDDAERKTALEKLDAELAGIIERVSEVDWGKKFELEEIYLLRRLIHDADTGHLISVNHGTPRQDMNPQKGSVDIEVAAAGDAYQFQLKTFKLGTHAGAREQQAEVWEKARKRLPPGTQLVALGMESVREAFERALRQPKERNTSRGDKYEALEPITTEMDEAEREKLLYLLGLTEQDLHEEHKAFLERQTAANEQFSR